MSDVILRLPLFENNLPKHWYFSFRDAISVVRLLLFHIEIIRARSRTLL